MIRPRISLWKCRRGRCVLAWAGPRALLVDFPTAQPGQALVGGVGSGEYVRPGARFTVSAIARGCRWAMRLCAMSCETSAGLGLWVRENGDCEAEGRAGVGSDGPVDGSAEAAEGVADGSSRASSMEVSNSDAVGGDVGGGAEAAAAGAAVGWTAFWSRAAARAATVGNPVGWSWIAA